MARVAASKMSSRMDMSRVRDKVHIQEEADYCQICRIRGKHRQATNYCTNCNMPLCKFCSTQHRKTKVTEDHQIVPKAQQEETGQVCATHRFAAVKYFCNTCEKLICVNCTMIEHRNHELSDMKTQVENSQGQLKKCVENLDGRFLRLNTELRKIDDIQRSIEENREQIKVEVNSSVVQLQQTLKSQQEQLLASTDMYLDSKLELLAKAKESLQRKFDDVSIVREGAELNRIDTEDEKFILDVVKLEQQIRGLREETIKPLNESKFTGLRFVMTNNGTLGRVEDTNQPLSKSFPRQPIKQDGELSKRLKIIYKFKTTSYIQTPAGIAVLPGGKFVIADASNHGLLICDRTGRYQQRILLNEISYPTGVVYTKKGQLAVTTDKWVKIFMPNGKLVSQFNAFPTPTALAVDDLGNYVVSDAKSRNVTVYDEEGKHIQKMYTTDSNGNAQDPFNLSVNGQGLALSYQSYQVSFFVKVFNFDGKLLQTAKLPEACHGVQLDRVGNAVAAAGELVYVPAAGNGSGPIQLGAVDKSGKSFILNSRCVAFTPEGHICTLHVSPINKRSEFVILEMFTPSSEI